MQQRQLRLGDILDDYCPRERRVTNHAIVAMIGADVKQTRCTTCDEEHVYKKAKIPAQRWKKELPAALYDQVLAGMSSEADASPPAGGSSKSLRSLKPQKPLEPMPGGLPEPSPTPPREPLVLVSTAAESKMDSETMSQESPIVSNVDENGPGPDVAIDQVDDEVEGPVHRRLIRATLPRTEGTVPVRQIPEFTIRQNNGRSGKPRASASQRHRLAGGGSDGQTNGGGRNAGRSNSRTRIGGQASSQHRSAQHPSRARVARSGKKRSR